MRSSQQIKAEIQEKFGFVPPFFEPAGPNPAVLENLWQQTLDSYVNNPFSAVFKEKLSAYLSRYCTVPYCMVCHSCSLVPLGVRAREVLKLLEAPPPTELSFGQHLQVLTTHVEQLALLSNLDQAVEESLLHCAIFISLEQGPQTDYYRAELRRLLGSINYQHLITFIAYVKTCHVWIEAHPEVAYDSDQRVLNYFQTLLQEEPSLSSFFQHYRDRIRQEQQQRIELMEQKRTEAMLRESEERFRFLAENSTDMISRHSLEGVYLYVSSACRSLLGYTPEELLGHSAYEFFHPEDLPNITSGHEAVLELPSTHTITYRIRRQDGRYIWFETTSQTIRDQATGKALEIHAASRDITERKQVEEALQRQNLRSHLFAEVTLKIRQSLQLEEILQTAVTEVQKIFQTDRVLVFRLWPSGYGKVVTEAVLPGCPSILGQGITDDCFSSEYLKKYGQGRIYTISDVNQANVPPCLVEFLQEFDVRSKLVMPILLKAELWGLLIAHQCKSPREWSDFEIDLLQQLADQIGIALAQAQLLEQEVRQRQELTNSNAELQQFASIASHDLQEPLRKIQAFGNRLKSACGPVLTEQGLDYLDRMQNAAQRMQALINDLLILSRITTKSQIFRSVNLTTSVQEVLSDLEVRLQQTGGQVEVGPLPIIEADPLQMRQLWQNLISNALKFHRPGESPIVKIESHLLEEQWQSATPPLVSDWCDITVTDNGIGFDEKYLDRIFNVFQRLHNRSEYEGTGMGLAICRKIVEQHGGSITASSTPGQGAVFRVTLPMKQHRGDSPP